MQLGLSISQLLQRQTSLMDPKFLSQLLRHCVLCATVIGRIASDSDSYVTSPFA